MCVSYEDRWLYYLVVVIREFFLFVNGVKGDESFEEFRDNDWGIVKSLF